MINELLSESLAFPTILHSVSQTAGTYTTAAIDLSKFRQLLFIVDCGTAGSSATVNFSLTGSATSGGSYTALTGTSATALSASSTTSLLCVRADQLIAANPTVQFIKGSLVVGVATSVVGVYVIGALGGYEPQNQYNSADIQAIVNV